MKPIRTQPRFRCDFCKRTGTRATMNRHERICFRDPNRTCDICGGKGVYEERYDEGLVDYNAHCPYCYDFVFKTLEKELGK